MEISIYKLTGQSCEGYTYNGDLYFIYNKKGKYYNVAHHSYINSLIGKINMKKLATIIAMFVMIFTILLSGCTEVNPTSNDENKFVGTWKSSGGTITFLSNGTCSLKDIVGEWKINDGKLLLTLEEVSLSKENFYSFSDNDNTLTLTSVQSGSSEVFIRQ